MIDVPETHLEAGIVEPGGCSGTPENRFMTIRTSKKSPTNAVVSVPFRGWWYYIDASDTRSKASLGLMRRLIRLCLTTEGEHVPYPDPHEGATMAQGNPHERLSTCFEGTS